MFNNPTAPCPFNIHVVVNLNVSLAVMVMPTTADYRKLLHKVCRNIKPMVHPSYQGKSAYYLRSITKEERKKMEHDFRQQLWEADNFGVLN